ncbi:MAG: hypothetical protein AAF328_02220 [Planctomycetota bacterium]
MFDPRARRRPTPAEKSIRAFYRLALTGAAMVALAILVSTFTGPVNELIHREWATAEGNLATKALTVGVNATLYLLAYLLPMLLVAGGVALPVVALVRFRDFALHPKHRRTNTDDAPRFPLRTAWLLVLAEVPALVLFAALAMTALNASEPHNPGLGDQEIFLDPPGQDMPYYRD